MFATTCEMDVTTKEDKLYYARDGRDPFSEKMKKLRYNEALTNLVDQLPQKSNNQRLLSTKWLSVMQYLHKWAPLWELDSESSNLIYFHTIDFAVAFLGVCTSSKEIKVECTMNTWIANIQPYKKTIINQLKTLKAAAKTLTPFEDILSSVLPPAIQEIVDEARENLPTLVSIYNGLRKKVDLKTFTQDQKNIAIFINNVQTKEHSDFISDNVVRILLPKWSSKQGNKAQKIRHWYHTNQGEILRRFFKCSLNSLKFKVDDLVQLLDEDTLGKPYTDRDTTQLTNFPFTYNRYLAEKHKRQLLAKFAGNVPKSLGTMQNDLDMKMVESSVRYVMQHALTNTLGFHIQKMADLLNDLKSKITEQGILKKIDIARERARCALFHAATENQLEDPTTGFVGNETMQMMEQDFINRLNIQLENTKKLFNIEPFKYQWSVNWSYGVPEQDEQKGLDNERVSFKPVVELDNTLTEIEKKKLYKKFPKLMRGRPRSSSESSTESSSSEKKVHRTLRRRRLEDYFSKSKATKQTQRSTNSEDLNKTKVSESDSENSSSIVVLPSPASQNVISKKIEVVDLEKEFELTKLKIVKKENIKEGQERSSESSKSSESSSEFIPKTKKTKSSHRRRSSVSSSQSTEFVSKKKKKKSKKRKRKFRSPINNEKCTSKKVSSAVNSLSKSSENEPPTKKQKVEENNKTHMKDPTVADKRVQETVILEDKSQRVLEKTGFDVAAKEKILKAIENTEKVQDIKSKTPVQSDGNISQKSFSSENLDTSTCSSSSSSYFSSNIADQVSDNLRKVFKTSSSTRTIPKASEEIDEQSKTEIERLKAEIIALKEIKVKEEKDSANKKFISVKKKKYPTTSSYSD